MMKIRRNFFLLLLSVLLIVLPGLINGQYAPEDIPYDDCGGSDSNQIASIRLTGCEEDEICQITMGDNLTIKVTWKTFQTAIKKLKTKLEVQFFLSFKTEVDILPQDACQNLKCPIKKNNDVQYVANFTVPTTSILPGNGRIWWKVFEESEDNPLLCVNFQVNINSRS